MSRSGRGRTQPFNRSQGRERLEYARRCHEAAELVGSDDTDSYAAKVAVSLYVLAGIAASDAICGVSVGERWRGEDHRGAGAQGHEGERGAGGEGPTPPRMRRCRALSAGVDLGAALAAVGEPGLLGGPGLELRAQVVPVGR